MTEVGESIGAYFWKRKQQFCEEIEPLDEKGDGGSGSRQRAKSLSIFDKVGRSIGSMFSSKYLRRYFKIDTKQGKLMYADDEAGVETKPSFSTTFGQIASCRANVVSMPVRKADLPKHTQASKSLKARGGNFVVYRVPNKLLDWSLVDLGPDDYNVYTLEIYLHDRMFTLYSDSEWQVRNYENYINKILRAKERMIERQQEEDQRVKREMAEQKREIEQRTKDYIKKVKGQHDQMQDEVRGRPKHQ